MLGTFKGAELHQRVISELPEMSGNWDFTRVTDRFAMDAENGVIRLSEDNKQDFINTSDRNGKFASFPEKL